MAKRKKDIAAGFRGVTRGSESVFADLGFPDAEELQIKAELARQLYHRIQNLGLTQIQAAELLGLKQPDVSKLMQGRYTGFSTDRLISLLNAAQIDVEIVLRPSRKKKKPYRGTVKISKAA